MEKAAYRLTELRRRIAATAYNLAQQFDPTATEDIVSEIVLAILERYTQFPDFLDQASAYVVNYGAWRARDVLRRHSHTPTLPHPHTLPLPHSCTNPWPAVDLQLAVEHALANLDDTGRHIASGLAAGYTPREIGPALGIHFQTVYNRMRDQLTHALVEV